MTFQSAINQKLVSKERPTDPIKLDAWEKNVMAFVDGTFSYEDKSWTSNCGTVVVDMGK
jgi:hypothetical protein